MMEKVEAWKDKRDMLHVTRRAAAIADLAFRLDGVWAGLPPNAFKHAGSLSDALAQYPGTRKALIDALLAYEMDVK